MVDEYEKQMDLMYSEHFEKYTETKENLEKELQVCESMKESVSSPFNFLTFVPLIEIMP